MKKAIVILLALALCLSVCACSGNNKINNPGAEKGETAETGKSGGTGTTPDGETEDGSVINPENGGAPANSEGGSAEAPKDIPAPPEIPEPDSFEQPDGSSGNVNPQPQREPVDFDTPAPESTQTYNYTTGGRDLTISYAKGMNVAEENDMVCVTSGKCRMYIDDVTDEYSGTSDNPQSFIYNYAYSKSVGLVNSSFGGVTAFDGEHGIEVTGNEVVGYGATMVCGGNSTVYAFVKLVELDGGGYAVKTGITDGANATVFDNIAVH